MRRWLDGGRRISDKGDHVCFFMGGNGVLLFGRQHGWRFFTRKIPV
jgi:hypothetical protein